jgi:hypothetical protein
MRLLALSDIHGNVTAVRQVRTREGNIFDAIVVAGDIGNEGASEIFGVLSSFMCPVLYVYGNWDNELEYEQSFRPSCAHLHLRSVKCGSISFAGFSGLPAHWGLNPIAKSLRDEVAEVHRAVVQEHSDCEASVDAAVVSIESNHEARTAELAARAKDRRTAGYRTKVTRLENQRDVLTAKARLPLERLEESQEYLAYLEAWDSRRPEIATLNRRAMVDTIRASDAGQRQTIVVTHERLSKTAVDLLSTPMFLFGHKHGFYDRSFAGSRFVNVSVLDNPVTVLRTDGSVDGFRNINAGNYTIVEILSSASDFDVRCVNFEPDFDGWERQDVTIGGVAWADGPK